MDLHVHLFAVVLLVFYFSTRVLRAGSAHIFALLLSLVVCAIWWNQSDNRKQGYLHDMEHKYVTIGSPGLLYADARLVEFFYWLRDWRKANPDAYDNAMDATEGLLRLEEDAARGGKWVQQDHDVAVSLYRSAMNHMHSMIFSIEHPVEVQRLRNALATLQGLLLAHLDVITLQRRRRGFLPYDVTQPAPAEWGMRQAADSFLVY